MQKQRSLWLLLIFSMLIVPFATSLENYPTKQVNNEFTFCQPCADATYITLTSIETPNSTININANMTEVNNKEFCYNYTPTNIGRHDFRGISDGCVKTFSTDIFVTLSGVQENITLIISDIFIILSLSFLIFIIHDKYKKIDYSDSNKKTAEAHDGKWGVTFIKTLGNNLMRNSFLWYYSLGWLLLIVFRDLVYNFNGFEVYRFFVFFMDIYSFGFFLIIVTWIGILFRHFNIITEIINDLNSGVDK